MSMKLREPIYFGCGSRLGHYAFQPNGSLASRGQECRWIELLDGLLPPDDAAQHEGRARLHRFSNCTALAFWDRSVDHRKASNSAFFLSGQLTFDEALAASRKAYPWVFARIKFEIVNADAEGERLLDYESVIATIDKLPQTWIPAVLCRLVETAYAKDVFVPGGASETVRKVELRMGADK